MADPPLAGYPPSVIDGWGARPLRWLSVLVCRGLSEAAQAGVYLGYLVL